MGLLTTLVAQYKKLSFYALQHGTAIIAVGAPQEKTKLCLLYSKLCFSHEGAITTSRFYASPDLNFTFKKNVLLVSKHDLNLPRRNLKNLIKRRKD